MSAILDSAKGIIAGVTDAATGAAREAAREIDRRRRIIGIESEIGEARREIAKHFEAAGQHMLTLHISNAPGVPDDVAALCRQIIALEEQIKRKEQEISAIAQEGAPPANPPVASPPAGEVDAASSAQPVAAPLPFPLPSSVPQSQPAQCPNCGAPLSKPGVKFCTACGAKLST